MFRYFDSIRLVLSAILTIGLSIGLLIPLNSFQINVSAENSKEKNTEQTKNKYSRSPLYFEENRGQFPDHVRFAARNSGSQMFLTTSGEAVFVLRDETKTAAEDEKQNSDGRAVAVFMRPVGSNLSSEIVGEEMLTGKMNYFKGNDSGKWQTDVPTFARTETNEIYPGVSLVWYGSGAKSVEYDFVVASNANPNQIEWQIDGAEDVSLDEEGNLIIETECGTLKQQKPFSYQETNGLRAEVKSGYVVEKITNGEQQKSDGFRVKFNVGGYDQTKPLVIDPNVNLSNTAFSTLLGGEATDRGNAIAVDASGNTYITGMTQSLLFPKTPGAFDTTNISDSVFVTKMNAAGTNLIYSTYIDGSGSDESFGIEVDSSGNAYLTGSTNSNNFPVTAANAFDSSFNNGFEVFFTKLNPTGSALIYSTYLGGASSEQVFGIDIDSSGNAYLTGFTSSTDFPTTTGAFDTVLNSTDAFVSKINPSLSGAASIVYSTYLGGAGSSEFGIGVAVDSSGSAYITGSTSSSDFPTTAGAFDTTHNGSSDVFVTKLNSDGTAPVYSTYIGGDSFDQGNDIAVDTVGQAYITGITSDGSAVDYPTTSLAFDTTPNGSEDVFVTKLNLTGSSLSYSTYIGGSGLDRCHDIAIDSSGAVYITGTTQDSTTDYPTTANASDPSQNGGQDIFVSKIIPNFFLPASAQVPYSTFIGSSGFVNEEGTGIAVDSSGNVYITGQVNSPATVSIPTTFEAFQPNHNGGTTDSFICKFGDYAIAGRVLDSNLAPVAGVAVTMAGHQSGAVLSDSQGYFAFTDTVQFGNFAVMATRAGMAFNPSSFSIGSLNNNSYMNFVGVSASPTGFPGGIMRVFPIYDTDENSDYITIAIERVQVYSDNVVTIDYKTTSGTAAANEDFVYQQGTLTFLPFESVKTIQVPIINDRVFEGGETFSLVLSNPTGGATLSENAASQITINDDDTVRKRKPREPMR